MGGFADLGEGGGMGRVWRRPKNVNLGRKWVETEGEGKSSCQKLRVALAVLLVVADCQNMPLEININAKIPNTGISDLRNIFAPIVR